MAWFEGGSVFGRVAGAGRVVAVVATVAVVPLALATIVVATGDDSAAPQLAVTGSGTSPSSDEAPPDGATTPTAATTETADADGTDGPITVDGSKPGPTTTTTTGGSSSSTSNPEPTTTTDAPPVGTVPENRSTTTVPTPSTTTSSTSVTTNPPGQPTPPGPTTTTAAPPTTSTTTTTSAPPTTTTSTTTTTTAPPTVAMPQLVGLTRTDAVDQARATQRQLGYFGTTDAADCNGNVDPRRFGSVYAQTPAAGSPLVQGTPITLRWYDTCSRVPAVTGLVLEEAQIALRNAGLQASAISTCVVGVPDYVVISQDPGPGGIVRQGTAVTIVVNRGGCEG